MGMCEFQPVIFRLFRPRFIAPSLFFFIWGLVGTLDAKPKLSPLAKGPHWQSLEKYQDTITHDDFKRLLDGVYCTRGLNPDLIRLDSGAARIFIDRETQKWFTLRFAKDETSRSPVPRRWRLPESLPKRARHGVLSGLRIALDPGHIGGTWGKVEERWFQVGDQPPVLEGDMTLRVAKLLASRLQKLGARVSFVRQEAEPVTPQRPDDLREIARRILAKNGVVSPREDYDGPADPAKEQTVRWESEILFYRISEIRHRARVINNRLIPDLVLCLHFNAEAWGDPKAPTLVDRNHMHLLVNGAYLPPELEFDDQRFEMLQKLLSQAYDEEIKLSDTLAKALVKRTQLPAYEYTTENATKVGSSGYVYARNLLATRLYKCPVIYFEPYVMNSHDVFARVQAGDYDGTRSINGAERASIFREYADGIVDGLAEYFAPLRN